MEILKERILKEGRALSKVILKVDSFLNHGVDARLMYEIGENFYSTTEEENLDIGEWFFIVDLDDYLTR